tara:strand:- start:774 stop:1214 length:441 start_codon:yes stop_codon:yes gene_type:complete
MKILYVDIDGVLANFKLGVANSGLEKQYKGRPDKIPGVYKNLPLIEDAKNSIGKLFNSGLYDIYFLSSAPWDNPNAWTDKRLWVEKHFGLKTRKRLILSHRKDLQLGDYLIDDSPRNGAADFKGKWIHFGSEEFTCWNDILNFLLP